MQRLRCAVAVWAARRFSVGEGVAEGFADVDAFVDAYEVARG
jgi:hypothetical protein